MIVVEIDPGTAFGTGSHETTKLCIEGMKPYIKEDTKILDVGCGSGILSISTTIISSVWSSNVSHVGLITIC